MTVTWSYGGTALTTYGVVTKIDDYLDMPERRGENIVIPFRHGSRFVQKFYNERRVTLGMAIFSNSSSDQDYLFDQMHTKFSPRTQQVLSYTRADASVYNANATMDVPMQVERVHDVFAWVVLEFTLTEPYFRSSAETTDLATIDANPTTDLVVTNSGTAEERDPKITLIGPLTNPAITNVTNGCTLTYTGTIASSDTVVIETVDGEFTATLNGATDVIGNVTHSGASCLMLFNVGANSLSVASTVTTTGVVKVNFYAPFF
jgi:phage-related protein